jgi:hypothetical protein
MEAKVFHADRRRARHTDGRTDGYDETSSRFSQFSKKRLKTHVTL